MQPDYQIARVAKWLASPKYDDVLGDMKRICVCCNKVTDLRWISPGPGNICYRCYVYRPRCKNGCDDIAVDLGLCRACLCPDDDLKGVEVPYRSQSPLAKAQDLPDFGGLSVKYHKAKNGKK